MSKPIVISIAQCHEKFQELNLNQSGKRLKLSEELFFTIEQILEGFNIKVLPKPDDENLANQWKNEWKRIQTAYQRMIKQAHCRKLNGIFYDSSNYAVFAKIKEDRNEMEDPIYEVMLGSKRNKGRKTLHLLSLEVFQF